MTGTAPIGEFYLLDDVVAKVNIPERLTVIPISNATLDGANNFARQFGITDERGAAAAGGDFLRGTTHIDVDAVES